MRSSKRRAAVPQGADGWPYSCQPNTLIYTQVKYILHGLSSVWTGSMLHGYFTLHIIHTFMDYFIIITKMSLSAYTCLTLS